MSSLDSFLNSIKDGTAVRAAVPLVGVTESQRLPCVFRKGMPPGFTLVFPDGTLPAEQVDTAASCVVIFDFPDQSYSLSAAITAVIDPLTLDLTARDITTHRQARGYFRVPSSTRVAASAMIPEEIAQEEENWRLLGDTIDLSGSGVLCSFSEPLSEGVKARIELNLPTLETDVIIAIGHVVRCRKIHEHLYHIALHFDSIDPESQDKIMACCFELQRRHLRMRVLLEGVSASPTAATPPASSPKP